MAYIFIELYTLNNTHTKEEFTDMASYILYSEIMKTMHQIYAVK